MSKVKEFIINWNEFLPENRITEDDLKNVQESTFRYWLILLLNKLNVDTTCFENMHNENGDRLRASRLRLLSTVNHFLCVNNLMKLKYMNLINPDTKTVTRSMMYLLNYVFFVNHIYKETILKCAQKVLERDQLQAEKNRLRKEIEQAKIKEESYVRSLRDFDRTIPQQKNTIASLREKEERLNGEVKRISGEIEKSELKLAENNSQIASIKEKIVSDEEASSILSEKQKVLEELNEIEDEIHHNRHKLKDISAKNEVAQSQVTKMNSIYSEFSVDRSDLQEKKKNLEKLETDKVKLTNVISRNETEIKSLINTIEMKKKNIAVLRNKRENLEKTIGSEDKTNVQTLKELSSKLRDLCIQEDDLMEQKTRAKEELNLIYKISSNILKKMNENIYTEE